MKTAASASSYSDSRRQGLIGTVAVKANDVSIRAVVGDTPISVGPLLSKDGAVVRVEKPGFIFEYGFPEKGDLRFQFMRRVELFKKQLDWTYGRTLYKETVLDGSLKFSESNKFSVSYLVPSSSSEGQSSCKMKYRCGLSCGTSIEPSYDIFNKTWECMLSQEIKLSDRTTIAARYDSSDKKLHFEWLYRTLLSEDGCFKVLTSLDVSRRPQGGISERFAKPTVWAQNTWNLEL